MCVRGSFSAVGANAEGERQGPTSRHLRLDGPPTADATGCERRRAEMCSCRSNTQAAS